MKNWKRFLAALVSIVMMGSFICCGALAEAAQDEKTMVTVAWTTPVQSLSPVQLPAGGFDAFMEECLEGLGVYDTNYKFQKVMAKEITQLDEDGYRFNIEIYDYIHDSDGNPITVDDVLFSIEKTDESGNARQHLSKVKSLSKVDDYNLEVELKDNGVGVLEMFCWKVRIFSKKAWDESGDGMATRLVGTGPYKVVEYVNGSHITTEAVADYWQADESLRGPYAKQNVDVIKKVFITENSQREVALESGTVDLSPSMETSSIKQFDGNSLIGYNLTASHNNWTLFYSSKSALSDARLRKAVSYAIDKTAIIDAIFDGYALPCTLGLDFAGDYNPDWNNREIYAYNPEKSRELINEAGAQGTHLKLLCNSGTAGSIKMMELIQAYLLDVGFDAEVVVEENATFIKDVLDPSAYDINAEAYGLPTTVQIWRLLLDEANWSGGTRNGFDDSTLQEMLKVAYTPNTHTQENMDALFDYLTDQEYIHTLCRAQMVAMWRTDSGVTGVYYNASRNLLPHCGGYRWNET